MLKPAPDKGLRMVTLERQNCLKPAVYAGQADCYDTVVLASYLVPTASVSLRPIQRSVQYNIYLPEGPVVYWNLPPQSD